MAKCNRDKQNTDLVTIKEEAPPNYTTLEEPEIVLAGKKKGIFNFPDIKATRVKNYGERKFLVLFFDDIEKYNDMVKWYCPNTGYRNKERPEIDIDRLWEISKLAFEE